MSATWLVPQHLYADFKGPHTIATAVRAFGEALSAAASDVVNTLVQRGKPGGHGK